MALKDETQLGVNSWFEDELREQFKHDRGSIDESWKHLFEQNGSGTGKNGTVAKIASAAVAVPPGEELTPLRGAAGAIAKNMAASISIPLATSQRTIPVKVIDENRRLINHHRALIGKSKVSFTHLIGWALVKAVEANPAINHAFAESGGELLRILHKEINLGIAIDVAGKNGARSLMVPNIKNAAALGFGGFQKAFDDLVARARTGKLAAPDFAGTTISLTNPGTVGTMASIPRLMTGQGAIVAVGAMDFAPGFRGVAPETQAALGISKVMTVTCTYDHRIIQGAESGSFLGTLQSLLDGEQDFYTEVFHALHIPYQPVRWETDHKGTAAGAALTVEASKQAAVLQLINAFRVRGHLMADLDPLNGKEPDYHDELDPLTYGLTIWDLDRDYSAGNFGAKPIAPLRETLEQLRATYCGKIACEYMHIQFPDQKRWLQERMEPRANNWPLDRPLQLSILDNLLAGEEFEHFLHARFVGQKRFSLEGAETAIPILEETLNRAADHGAEEVVIGMAHRGRLNVLANTVGKPLSEIFAEFEGNADTSTTQGSGDVKYHLGAQGARKTSSGKEIAVYLASNPSHLEAVNPVVEGIVRPKQDLLGDTARERVIPILIHGDAAFAGQGIVAETLNLSQLDGYSTGGTIHLIINNQIGFTTLPGGARSTTYSTDVARMVQAPIFHVNGDDPEAAIRVVQMAFDFRQQFKKDVVIDMFCYRRHGHNEGDDPAYTQPILYRKIEKQPSVAVLYASRLVKEKVLTAPEAEEIRKHAKDRYSNAFDAGRGAVKPLPVVEPEPPSAEQAKTAIGTELVERVVDRMTAFPDTFTVHPKLRQFNEKRREAVRKNGAIDWAYAEALAFGSLVLQGTPVRLSGQDTGRGTFSQRHLAFYDYENGDKYIPMRHLSPDQARFDVFDSSLSEYAVLGFEFGYTLADPKSLVLWEAQFGDFGNGAQIMIDQFITTAESKWGVTTSLVMLLPHGYEGQGPEHSSARIERFLELCAANNMIVANCTTPAQYFHLLRRQAKLSARKPLIVFTPKSLLRSPKAVSTFADITDGTFREVLPDPIARDVKRIVFSTGKVYYDLLAQREKTGTTQVALVRLEQIYPFAGEQVAEILKAWPEDAELVWCQEEPQNMGAWRFVRELFPRPVRYVGRAENSSPATGSKKRHDQEQLELAVTAVTL
ncbi:MAG: multifunctional oxoglutarate decarboxylase/oxoglutarate dehydrogenase thiamine pyrophosphate-binding subunit/dihydrolipoyllysine-residue succinyltransferase subunit [Acidobacteriota bacterium]|nr:multifunctional oxoglutarate decarboxylase/oxoglutarate dehydrogenase thiamine pyrophosphate-binding subunit/dihydrolipoyllysine-residue succinyltransferase subunit [Acidobacteriota bacterium]